MTVTDPPDRHEAPCLRRPPGHGLLEGKIVVVTAAAGTGIGFAAAKRCIEEGATVVVSDAHERRWAETAEPAGRAGRGNRRLAVRCNVTDESQVEHLYDAAVEAARALSTWP